MRESFTAESSALHASPNSSSRPAQLAAAVLCLLALVACGEEPRYAKSAPTSDSAAATPTPETPRGPAPPRTNLPMPPVASSHGSTLTPGWTLLSGQRESLADNRGKVLIVDLYATYCGPCIEEIPHLIALQRRHDKQGLRVVGLNVGGEEDRRLVPQFVERLGIHYDLGNPDDDFITALSGGETAIPRTYVFDRQGRLVDFTVGYGPSVARQLDEAVQTALETKQ